VAFSVLSDERLRSSRSSPLFTTRIPETLMPNALLATPLSTAPFHFPKLTARQCQLWTMLARGDSNQAMARNLGLSIKWVDCAVGLLYGALSIDTADRSQNPRVCAVLLYIQFQADRSGNQRAVQNLI